MQKIIKIGKKVVVTFSNGSHVERDDVSDEMFKKITDAKSDDEVYSIMVPEYNHILEEYLNAVSIRELVETSEILVFRGESVYWDEVSRLSMPMELVKAVLCAERDKDKVKIDTYRNFWTLMSLNPDSECRKNLFWFLNRNGLSLSRHGFFVAYRNVEPYKVDDDGTPVYTDTHSRTTRVRIGEMVTIPRDECDCDSSVECSRGLHLASKNWLNRNYFGSVGMVCLCNPADVVAVPYNSEYGKLRTCAYLPIEKLEYGDDNRPIPYPAEDGFDCSYVTKVIYEGLMGTEEDSTYKITIPELPSIDKEIVSSRLLDIAMKCITERQV